MNILYKISISIFIIAIIGMAFTLLFFGKDIFEPNINVNELTDEQIVEISTNQSSYGTCWLAKGDASGVRNKEYRSVDYDETFFSAKKINGIKTVSSTMANDCTVNLEIDSSISKGNARIVVIIDDKIVEEFEAGENKSLEYTVDGEHFIYVKILCEDAEIEIKTTREFK